MLDFVSFVVFLLSMKDSKVSQILDLRNKISSLTGELLSAYAQLSSLVEEKPQRLYTKEEMIKVAVNELSGDITTRDVNRYLKIRFNSYYKTSTGVSYILKKLASETPNIELIKPSSGGSSLNVYKRLSPYNLDFLIK